jgi:hypothetical protein
MHTVDPSIDADLASKMSTRRHAYTYREDMYTPAYSRANCVRTNEYVGRICLLVPIPCQIQTHASTHANTVYTSNMYACIYRMYVDLCASSVKR